MIWTENGCSACLLTYYSPRNTCDSGRIYGRHTLVDIFWLFPEFYLSSQMPTAVLSTVSRKPVSYTWDVHFSNQEEKETFLCRLKCVQELLTPARRSLPWKAMDYWVWWRGAEHDLSKILEWWISTASFVRILEIYFTVWVIKWVALYRVVTPQKIGLCDSGGMTVSSLYMYTCTTTEMSCSASSCRRYHQDGVQLKEVGGGGIIIQSQSFIVYPRMGQRELHRYTQKRKN